MPSEILNSLHQNIQNFSQNHVQIVASSSSAAAGTSSAHPLQDEKFLVLRALIPVADAGLIIGKGGQNIQLIRDQTSAKIRLSEFVSGSQERIVSVSGSPSQVAKAFSMVSQIDPMHLNVLHFLVPHTQMGAIIGKSGTKIRELQQISHCKLVASEQLLPNSTERWVCVSSQTPQDLYTCVELLAELLASSGSSSGSEFDRGFVAYKPVGGASPVFQQVNAGAGGSRRRVNGSKDSINTSTAPDKPHRNSTTSTSTSTPKEPTQQESEEQLINIPSDLVGAIIGKAGVRISEIRKVSGAQIRILDAVEGQDTRVASVSGSRASIGVALSLICKRMEIERNALEG